MKPVALILGAGANIGASTAREFANNGYAVAVSSRGVRNGTSIEGYLNIQADLADKLVVPRIFEIVKSLIGIPSIAVYNAAAFIPPSDLDILSISLEDIERDTWVNRFNALVAAKCAVDGFKNLPRESKKTFIYIGNWLNTKVSSSSAMLTLGIGKAASAYWIGAANQHYSMDGYRFFYVDQRTPEGTAMRYGADGEANAKFFQLAQQQDQSVPWHVTFVKNKGYENFT